MDRRIVVLGLCALCACASRPPQSPPGRTIEFAWTEIGPAGQTTVRAVTSGSCPSLEADDRTLPMQPRGTPSAAFPRTVCEAFPPGGVHSLKIDGVSLPLWRSDVNRILFLGDTGCRIKKGKSGTTILQDCNDPQKWPFARLAALAAAWQPDLVIHVGDYHYREAECPPNEAKCAGSIAGDQWGSWRQDFFVPAEPLLKNAPWIFVRGNHESCKRAGNGWFRLLDPRPLPESCAEATPVYEIPMSGHRLSVIDANTEKNIAPSLDVVAPSSPQERVWLLLHRPFLTPEADDEALGETRLPKRLSSPGAVGAVFTGHRHILSLNRFSDSRPPELIAGNGGDTLDVSPKGRETRFKSSRFGDFGFMTFERKSGEESWIIKEHDRNGAIVFTCLFKEPAGGKTEIQCDDGR